MPTAEFDVLFSNASFRVKRFQTIHHYSVDVAHGLVLLYGIGTKALPSWDSKTGRKNLSGGLLVSVTTGPRAHANSPFVRPCRQCDDRSKRTCELTSSIVPQGTSFHRSVGLDF